MSIKYSDEFMIFDDPVSGERRIISVEPLKLSSVVSSALDSTIEADVIVVDKPVDAGGRTLKLRCRELHFIDESSIGSTGAAGTPNFPPGLKAIGAQDPGKDGADGSPGGDGQRGGTIDICAGSILGKGSIHAIGGQGGRGQDGGDGIAGATGSDGRAIHYEGRDEPHISKYSGQRGMSGGRAGLPGINGAGGIAGILHVICLNPAPDSVVCKTGTGNSGENSNPGKCGSGGAGGKPGKLFYDYWVGTGPEILTPNRLSTEKLLLSWEYGDAGNHHIHHSTSITIELFPREGNRSKRTKEIRAGNPGGNGADGETRDVEVKNYQKFITGISTQITTEIQSSQAVGSFFSEEFLELQISSIEDEFRASGFEIAGNFLGKINFYLAITEKSNTESKLGFFSRLCSIARKLQLGLDFFGYTKEHVPLLAMSTYRELLDKTILDQVRFIEQQYEFYISKLEKKDELITGLQQVRNNARGQIITFKNIKATLEIDIIKLGATIPALNASIQDALDTLLEGRKKLAAAFQNKTGPGCDYVSTLTTAAVLVAGVVATGGAALAVVGATGKFVQTWNDNNKSASTLWDAKSVLSEGLKPVSSSLGDVADGIKKIQTAYKDLTDDQKSRNLPSLSIERDKFDQIAKDFADIKPEAEEYRALGYAYLDRIESRNKAILDYNALLVRFIETSHLLDAAISVEAVAESAVMGSVDLAAPVVFTRLKRIRRATLDAAAQLIHAQEKAMGYHFGIQVTPKISARNAAEISAAHAAVNLAWIRAKESYIPIKKLISGAFKIPLKHFTAPQDWSRFVSLESGDRPIHINIDVREIPFSAPLRGMPGLRITGARLILDGITLEKDDQIKWWMYQDGRESIINQNGDVIRFTKLPTKALQGFISNSDIVDSDNSENGLYSGYSIFSTWRLVVAESTRKIDFKNLTDLILAVDGYYMA